VAFFQQIDSFEENAAKAFGLDSLKESWVVTVFTVVDTARMATRADELIPTRESLLSRLKDMGDRDSWQDFFATYWKLIYGVARKAGLTDAEAQDIVQETVISVAKNIETFRYDPTVCSFKTWMLRLTRWRILNQLKRRQRDGLVQSTGTPPGETEDGTAALERIPDPAGVDLEVAWDEEWKKNLLSAALERVKRKINPDQIQIFDLCCVEKWPAQKIARTLNINIGQVYLAKHRVGKLLKRELDYLKRTLD
jgi:RNA polymerase sigma-70 factor (ECF subfamily)